MDKKLIIAIIDEGIRDDVLEQLQARGVEHYTLQTGVEGVGETGPRHGTRIWPGRNDMFLIVVPGPDVDPLIDAMHELRDSYPITPGMRFIITEAEFI